ncbi:MAG: hypothetical protein WAU01_12255 [Saprospiraceae bacterium]
MKYQIFDYIDSVDVRYILQNPWSLTASEWPLGDDTQLDESLRWINKKLELCQKDGFITIWKTTEGQAIALLGFYMVGIKKYETFFVASSHMDAHAIKISIDLRKILKEKESTQYQGCTCRLYSASLHPKQVDWFKFIGFTYLPKQNIGNNRCFEYKSISEI